MTQNQIAWAKVQEERRANRAKELIQYESNAIAAQGNTIAMRNAETNAMNAQVNLLNARTRENEHWETVRANLAREAENTRTNMANESIRIGQLNESIRSNQANESIASWYNAQRIDQGEASLWQQTAQHKTDQYKAAETARHNKASEQLETRKTNQGALKAITEGFGKILNTVGAVVGILA